MTNKHTSTDELRERLLTILQEPKEDMTTPQTDRVRRLIEAYIKTNYILKADVEKAIGKDEPRGVEYHMAHNNSAHFRARLRAEIRESLNLEGVDNV